MISSQEIRNQFIEFFRQKKHKEVRSAPVIPIDDPTLLFTNAGMNQFKSIFLGQKKTEHSRVVDSQKCIRAGGKHNDLEEVGKDGFHHTFFEMLGNWSFDDYYKKKAIIWAWELLTEVWKLPKEKLYATVHKTDGEAYELWKKETDIDPQHIEYHGDKDNFWEMGNTGPCGPCSEIHYDRGPEFCNLQNEPNHKCLVNGDCHRYIELWNLVFIQYNRDSEGKLHHLSQKFVDTGAGFERICQVLQHKNSNYDTDLFMPIIQEIENMSKKIYLASSEGISHRVIADHIRALTFALADGGMPSNEGRGYVLRRILRRAARHGRLLEIHKPFLYKLVKKVVKLMGTHYEELTEKQAHIELIIKAEEERFNQTLDKGLEKFDEFLSQSEKTISGKNAFMLYDTYGFPFDLTKVMAEEKGFEVDEKNFQEEMKKQKQRAREAHKFDRKISLTELVRTEKNWKTKFVGYETEKCESKLIAFQQKKDDEIIVVLDKTPFYAESGGQVADTGKIYNKDCKIEVNDVQKENDIFFHFGKILSGKPQKGIFTAKINSENRKAISRNHTATHLLHKALKLVLGEHVNQKGSLVNPEHLRFDFTHFQKMSARELQFVEEEVNRQVRNCLPVQVVHQKLADAKKSGAVALFGEKYGEDVRVVSMGDFTRELCGGIHLNFTGEIGFFKIIAESSIAAGIRRIEAITGKKAEEFVQKLQNDLEDISSKLHSPISEITDKIEKLLTENKEQQMKLQQLKTSSASHSLDNLIKNARKISSFKLVTAKVNIEDQTMMRQLGDQLKNKLGSGIGVLAAENDGKVSLIAVVTKDLTKKYQAGKIIGKVAKIVSGGGGGRPDMAMAGGKDVKKISEALAEVPNIISKM